MSSPYNHGIQTGSMLPSIYYDPELNKQLRTAHILFQDNYEKYFKRYGIDRSEMLVVMCDLSKVDPLGGTTIYPYLPAPEEGKKM